MLMFLPLVAVEVYLASTLFLFLAGPFAWPRIDTLALLALLLSYQAALGVGYYIGAYPSAGIRGRFEVNRCFKVGLIASIALIVPYTYVYTGKFPWDILRGIPDQAQAFAEYYDRLSTEATPERIIVMGARTLFAPLLVALTPLLFWTKRLGLAWKIAFVLYVGMYFAFSVLRGTDKESADFIVYFFAGLLSRIAAERFRKGFRVKRKNAALILAFLAISLWASYSAFMERKMARLGSDAHVCIEQIDVCADLNKGLMPYLDEKHRFGLSMATLYLSIGYYGMGLAIEEEFDSSLGLGHSIFISNAAKKVLGAEAFLNDNYTAKVAKEGWDPLVYWVTTYVWLANDIGFTGVLLLMVVIGFIFSRAWQDVVVLRDPVAVVLFSQVVLMLFYLPAFNMIMQNVDSYFSFVIWLLFWAVSRSVAATRSDGDTQVKQSAERPANGMSGSIADKC